MCEEPATDDEDALVAQRPKASTDLEQLLGVEARHRNLQHRHTGIGIHHGERHVGPVVESAFGLFGNGLIGEQAADISSELRRSR